MPSRHPESPFFKFTQRLKRAFSGKRKSGLFHSIFKFHVINTPTVAPGDGVDGPPLPLEILICSVFLTDFAFSKKPLIFLTRLCIFYGWWRC